MERADILRCLASSVRAGRSIRNAFAVLGARDSDELRRAARLAVMGADLDLVVAEVGRVLGKDADALRSAIELHADLGGDLGHTLERLATAIEERENSERQGRAHVAGTRLSARTIALLPIALVPMAPTSLATFSTPSGLLVALAGAALIACGFRWIGRLCPDPGERVADATMHAVLCGCLESGVELPIVLTTWARSPGAPPGLVRAARTARLGGGWSQALRESGHGPLVDLGRALEDSSGLGTPLVLTLGSIFSERQAKAAAAFETELRRAPVRMVIPLTVCVLPAYVLLGIVPFLRGMAGH